MSLIETSIRRPVTVTVIVALIVIFGLLAINRMAVQLTPNVDQPVVTVSTTWFGASPQEIVREILEEQEDVLKRVAGLREMTSQASEGDASIRLEFFVGVDKEAALNEVRDKLRQVPQYPADVDEPIVEAADRFSRDYIAWILVRPIPGYTPAGPRAAGYDGDITALGDFMQDYVKPVLERAQGVSEIQVLGGRERELQVRVNLEQLASRGITLQQVLTALRTENLDVTAGSMTEGKRETSIRVTGQYESAQDVLDTVVAYTEQGAPVYVHDVATAEVGFKKEIGFVRSQGIPVIAVNAQRETGSNVLQVMANLKAAINEVNRDVLGTKNWGIELHQVYDQTVYINDAVANATRNLVIGGVLAAAVLFLTLRSVGATIVVIIAIPISVIGTVLGMAMFGRSLNVVSLSGLTFAVGMGIDNAIVVLENIFRHREMGKDRFRAAIDGTKEVWGAIVAATLTNVIVFLPIIFIQEEAGQLFRDLSVALTISFFFYLFVAPTVIPMLTSLFLRRMPAGLAHEHASGGRNTLLGRVTAPFARAAQRFSELFYALTYWMTGGVFRRLAFVSVMVVGSALLALAMIPPRDYLPTGNQNLVFGFLLPPPGYSVDEYRTMATDHVEPALRPWWEAKGDPEKLRVAQQQWMDRNQNVVIARLQQQVEGISAGMRAAGASEGDIAGATAVFQGQIDDRLRTPPPSAIDNFFFVNFGSNVFAGATSTDANNVRPLTLLMKEATETIPSTFAVFFQNSIFRIGQNTDGLSIDVTGLDLPKVTSAAGRVEGELRRLFGFARSDPQNFDLGRDEVQIVPDRVRAAAAGLTGQDIRYAAQAAGDGVIVGDFRFLGRAIDLTLMTSAQRDARGREDLPNVPVVTANGVVVPLGSVARFVHTTTPQTIRRVEELPSVQFNVQLPAGMTIQEATGLIETEVVAPLREQGVLGPDVNLSLAGSASKLNAFMQAFLPGFALAALVTYLLLASLYENFLHPLTIMLSVPFAMVGGFVGLGLLHAYNPEFKLDVLTMLGFVILIGTIINSPILIVYQALNFMSEGMDRRRAISLSTQTRVRPIFMSVVTSIAGMTPLVLLGGAGSELYRGLGSVLVGGLALSTFFTLFLTPTLMSLTLDFDAGLKRLFRRGRSDGGGDDGGDGAIARAGSPAQAKRTDDREPALSAHREQPTPGVTPA